MCAADIPVEFSKGEAGRGQHEVNVTYADALETADRHLVFKNGIKEIAAQEGRAATFMAKWTMDDVGSSCHVHNTCGTRRRDEPLMARPLAPERALHGGAPLPGRPAPRGTRSWRGVPPRRSTPTGATCRAAGPPRPSSGGRTTARAASGSSATAPGAGSSRRVPGADVNPYLVIAACIAAGLYGIDHELELADAYPRNAYEAADVARIPSTLVEAIDELRGSDVAAEAFGADVHHHLLNTAQQEWEASNRHVSDWELRPQLRKDLMPDPLPAARPLQHQLDRIRRKCLVPGGTVLPDDAPGAVRRRAWRSTPPSPCSTRPGSRSDLHADRLRARGRLRRGPPRPRGSS